MIRKIQITKEIIYEDKDIIICHKPSGIAVQTARPGEPDMESILKNHLKSSYIGMIHRLDQPVEGLIVFAKNRNAAARLSRQSQGTEMNKRYYAVTAPERQQELQKEYVLIDYLAKIPNTNRSQIVSDKAGGAKRAELVYKVLQINGGTGTALAEIELRSGRHHQIRIQLANNSMALLGDNKYGSETAKQISQNLNITNIALCAYSLEFFHPENNKRMEFSINPSAEAFNPYLPINP